MKDKLPKGWEETTLNDVCEIITDGTHHTPKYEEKGVIFLSSKNVTKGQINWNDVKYVSEELHNQLQKRVSPKINDILLAKNGTTGVAAIVDRELVFDIYVSLALLRPKNDILPKFLLNFINSPKAKEQFNSRLKGVGVPNLHLREIKEVSLNIPSLDEQKQIVSVLDKTFEKLDPTIALIEENIQKLKQLNESVLDEVFRNSDKFVSFLDYVSVSRKTITPEHDKEYSIIGLENIESNSGKLVNFKPIKGSESISSKVIFKKENILYGKLRPYLNKVYLAEFDGIATTEIIPFTVDKNMFDEKYILYFLRSPFFLEKVNLSCSGARMPRVTTEFWKTLLIPFLTISEQQRIVEYLNQTTEKNQKLNLHYQNKLEALKRLKNSVLDSAFKGELRRAKVIPITQPVIDPYFARTKKFNAKKKADKQAMIIALALEAHEKIGKSLYRTKGEKTVEILEKHLNLDFGREAIKMTAGPADFKHLVNVVEPLANEKKWFYTQEIKGENYDGHKYIKAENFNPFMMRCVQDLKTNLNEVKRVINLFADMKTTRIAEVIATTYTGWNNLIVRKSHIDSDAIVSEARENWHEAKLKIDRQEFFDAIEWLKKNNLTPKGNGKEVN
ncbi:restriction endonuclease subunit S [Moheibacter sediminis]|uniref:Restriction endonuclease S subunit n=1 Tax=Moheibacter sediminis TaxID=1434700 RepID=A0A1W2BRJ5_9FLAO|nr:restriction endonuclease subunit S [Moheibacter sediminis]SMC75600.1 Restriction endonuclease S subunit [Moheibacter sediminis]